MVLDNTEQLMLKAPLVRLACTNASISLSNCCDLYLHSEQELVRSRSFGYAMACRYLTRLSFWPAPSTRTGDRL